MGAYSKLHNYTVKKIIESAGHIRIIENAHPDWLLSQIGTRLELDLFIPDLNIAAEIQGAQHFQYVPFFHGSLREFEKRKVYDAEKKNLCAHNKIRLVEICTETDADIFVKEILDKYAPMLGPEPKYSYFYEYSYYQELTLSKKIIRNKELARTRDEIKRQGFSNHKEMKKALQNSEEKKSERLASCRRKIEQFENGELQASEEKVIAWKRVVSENGYEEKCL